MIMMDITYNREDIGSVADQLATLIGDYGICTFEGDLGAGKTTLIAALCKRYGVKDPISSPTYALVNQYEGSGLPSGNTLYHLDLYRLKSATEGIDAGLEEYLFSGAICLIEWPSRGWELIPARHLEVKLTVVGPDERHMRVISREN
jgi:tRNA threonylcarbamoyladenosine biosynthesis protein TsaE